VQSDWSVRIALAIIAVSLLLLGFRPFSTEQSLRRREWHVLNIEPGPAMIVT
jgi:hypothetical protein